MRLLMGQLYDIRTSRQLEKLCVGEVLMPHVHLNSEKFRCAIGYVLYKYPVLRASFVQKSDELTMCFAPLGEMSVDEVFQAFQAQRETSVLRSQLLDYINDVRSTMSLQRPPLLRYGLFDSTQAHRQRLVLIFNHLVCDGISSRIVTRLRESENLRVNKLIRRTEIGCSKKMLIRTIV